MNRVCAEEGCHNGIKSGHALYRVSPKGSEFVGKCIDHVGTDVDPGVLKLTQAIQDDNGRREHEATA